MSTTCGTQSLKWTQPVMLNWLFAFLTAMLLVMLAPSKALAAPLAGANIGNAASATYTDAGAVGRTATSNTVNTTVQQVGAFTLTASQSKVVAPGGSVYFPHIITNTGNGPDAFNLTAVDANTGNITTFTAFQFFLDDGSGNPTGPAITVSPSLAAGGTYQFVLVATIGAQNNGDADTITVTADNTFDAYPNQINTDTVTVSANAVINVTKSMTPATNGASPSGPYTVTLTYTNTGNSTATDVALYDSLPLGMTYVASSGRWSVSGATVLTDGSGVAEIGAALGGIVYDTVTGSLVSPYTVAHTVYARVTSVAPGATGTVTFQVNIGSSVLAGPLNNTAKWCYDNNGATAGGETPATCTPTTAASVAANGTSTGTVTFTVNQVASVTVRDTGVSDAPLAQSDSDLTLNDIATVASAVQGATVSFKSVIVNNGNFADTFTIATSGSTFPAGTTFQIYQSDGVTPLVGATSAIAALGGTYNVFVKATLPIGATGGPFSVTVTATSVFNPAVLDTTTDTLTAITVSTVDLRNGAANTLGSAAGQPGAGVPELAPVTTNTVVPGATTTFVLKVNNTSLVTDNYNLAASTDLTFAAISLPAGWTVAFKADGGAGTCATTTGGAITNTGNVASSPTAVLPVTICAEVTVPANATPIVSPGQSIYFRVLSPGTGTSDRKHDAVIVQTVRSITLSPASQTGQVFPSSTINYTHIITNAGNVLEGATLGQVVLTVPLTGITAGWTAIIYWDRNNDGVLDAGDPIVTDLSQLTGGTAGASTAAGLDPTETARLFVRVAAPANAIGDVNTTTLTATTAGTINSIPAPPVVTSADQTTIIGGQVTLVKDQYLDPICTGVAGTYVQTLITTGANPGTCIRYRITATNNGTATVTNLVISDATPTNTKYNDGSGLGAGPTFTPNCTGTAGTAPAAFNSAGIAVGANFVVPACNTAGTIQLTVPSLAAGANVVLTFGVRIDP